MWVINLDFQGHLAIISTQETAFNMALSHWSRRAKGWYNSQTSFCYNTEWRFYYWVSLKHGPNIVERVLLIQRCDLSLPLCLYPLDTLLLKYLILQTKNYSRRVRQSQAECIHTISKWLTKMSMFLFDLFYFVSKGEFRTLFSGWHCWFPNKSALGSYSLERRRLTSVRIPL